MTPTDGKSIITVFCKNEEVTLVFVMPRDETIKSNANIKTLTKLSRRFHTVRLQRNPPELLLLHDNAHWHTSLKAQEAIAKLGSTVFCHPLCNHIWFPPLFIL